MGTGYQASKIAKRTYRKALKMSKRRLAKKYANTVGQIVRKKKGRRTKPSRGFRRSKRRYSRSRRY